MDLVGGGSVLDSFQGVGILSAEAARGTWLEHCFAESAVLRPGPRR